MIRTIGLPALLASLVIAGCAKNQSAMEPPPPADENPKAQLASDVRERVRELDVRAAEYGNNAKQMPAGTEDENRKLVSQQFALLSQIIPMLSGLEMPGDLAQQLRIIDSTRSQLSNGSTGTAPRPTNLTRLRAPQPARATTNQRARAAVPEVATSNEPIAANENDPDACPSPQHRWDAAQ